MKHLALILSCLPAVALAQAPLPDTTSDQIAQIDAGVICAPETTGTAEAPGTVAGTTHLIAEEPPFAAITRVVPAVLGVGFGVKSRSETPMGLSPVMMTVTHPPMGNDSVTTQTFETTIRGADASLTFYQFDFDYELLPGIWQMTATYNETVLYRTTFEVVSPDLVPELARICGFEDLLS